MSTQAGTSGVAVARAEGECSALVLVVAPNAEVAAWAAGRIDLGLGLGILQPLVLGPATVPVVTDPVEALKEVGLSRRASAGRLRSCRWPSSSSALPVAERGEAHLA